VLVVAAIHDVWIHHTGPRHPYAMEHASLVTTFVISYMLLRRFVQAGDELTRRTQELHRSYEELRNIQEELVRKEQLAAVGELSAVIAHEVRNPLAIMKNAVSGLRRVTLGDADRATLLEILDEEADRLNRLVHDLLAYARPVTLRGQPAEVGELVQDVVHAAASGGASHAVEVRIDLSDGPPTVHCDRDLLGRALSNVVENALQAMPAGGTLTVTSHAAALHGRDAIALLFRDTGEGMDTLVRSKARDPFFTTRASGTGLGLAIVERVIRSHGGELNIESRYGSGTIVEVILPLERPSTAPDEPSFASEAP
jgi:signal transduction histidine kinase